MIVKECIVHLIDKQPGAEPATIKARHSVLPPSDLVQGMVHELSASFNDANDKTWGFFKSDQGRYPMSRWLEEYVEGDIDLAGFSQAATEHLATLLSTTKAESSGYVMFAHCVQGITDYLYIAVLKQNTGLHMTSSLDIAPSQQLDLSRLNLATRINISVWRTASSSRQYLCVIDNTWKAQFLNDVLGCQPDISLTDRR